MIYVDLLDKKFEWGGRGPDTFDCYGLTREMFRRAGVIVADYPSSVSGSKNMKTMLHAAEHGWEKIAAPEAGCAVVFRVEGMCHIAYMLDRWEFIHVMEGTRVAVESINSPLWHNTVVGFYRWKGDLK